MFTYIQAGISCKWVNDSHRFLLEHFDIIHDSPPHIYHSALPFSPPSSWLHKYYASELLQEVRVVRGLQSDWGACSRTTPFDNAVPVSLAYWKDTIAVGLGTCEIVTLNAITGSQTAVLSGHTGTVESLAFSSDGILLVSGSDDTTAKLWDVQTGGVVKTFYGHTDYIHCVSISPDHTTFASGSEDNTIRLWCIQTGECFCVINGHSDSIKYVSFSPTNSQLLISASNDNTVRQWNINGCQIGSTCEGNGVAFSSDGILFVSWSEQVAIVQNLDSRAVVAELQGPEWVFRCCCFSPDSRFMAAGVSSSIYVWDITGSHPHLVKTLVGHADDVIALIFSSSLISLSIDSMVKFWQTSVPSTDQVTTDTMSTPHTTTSISSVSLQVRNSLALSADFGGVVKTWDIFTGLCKASFETPAKPFTWRDVQLIDGKLIFVWQEREGICIWDLEKGELLQKVDTSGNKSGCDGLRISGDGFKVFCLNWGFIQAWSVQTGEALGRVEVVAEVVEEEETSDDEMGMWDDASTTKSQYFDPLHVDGSKIWVCFEGAPTQGWDFGISGSSPVQLSNTFPDRPRHEFINGTTPTQSTGPSMIKDTFTGKCVFQLPRRYSKYWVAQWDGQYLIAGYGDGEVLILDFHHMLLQ